MSDESLAARLFTAESVVANLEDDICEAFESAKIPFEDFWYDSYDSSLEISGCDVDLTKEQQDVIYTFGFAKFWTHSANKDNRNDVPNTERLYHHIQQRS